MAQNKVKFVHFYGKEAEWKNRIEANKWENSIVFGKVFGIDLKCQLKIYAGIDASNNHYAYDIADLSSFIKLEEDIRELLNFVHVDASNNFTNDQMISALENFIAGSFTFNAFKDTVIEHIAVADNSINIIENTIKWVTEEGE